MVFGELLYEWQIIKVWETERFFAPRPPPFFFFLNKKNVYLDQN